MDQTDIRPVATPEAPTPAGHYAQGIVHGGLVYVAGQLPLDPVSGHLVGAGDASAQTARTLANVEAVLRAAGASLGRVLSLTVYVTGTEHWPAVNAACAAAFGAHRPARAIVPVPALRHGALIEIQAVAAVGSGA